MRQKNGKSILTFVAEDEDGGDWVEGQGHLSSLISVRAELGRGDLRTLHLGWLLRAQHRDLKDDAREPPPPGLAELSTSLKSFAEFLRIDPDLIRVAAGASPPLGHAEPKPAKIRSWLAQVPAGEKDDFLALFIAGDPALANGLVQRIRRERGEDRAGKPPPNRRTVAELLRAAGAAAEQQRRVEEGKAVKEKARREHETAAARAKHLDMLAATESDLWKRVEDLVATKQPKRYDEAVALLIDLRDLAALKNAAGFHHRLEVLRAGHARKPTLIEPLHKAGL